MSKKTKAADLIPALGYLRKSTKGERRDKNGNRRERQEKSISQQKAEIDKLADGEFTIVRWFEDEGVSGWKRGAKRPDFQRMLNEAKSLGAQAIICDNIDRFSRAAVGDVQEDANALHRAGVRWIVTASHGKYDLGARYDIGAILKFTVAVWSACEFSRQLGRRVALARRNAAIEGERTGGSVAYGLADDEKGGLKPGDPQQTRVVRWLFNTFGNELRSMNWMAGDLNARKVPGPSGRQWHVQTIRMLLRRRCYRGDFTFNVDHSGQFFGIDDKGEVVEASELNGKHKVFVKEGVYKPLIDPALFDKVQRRLALLAGNRKRRKRLYPLSGILLCGHCGSPMHGTRQNDQPPVYRCSAPPHRGSACGRRQVREDQILPFLVRMLGKEIANVRVLLSTPPDHLRNANRQRAEQHNRLQRDREKLTAQIGKAEEYLLLSPDVRTFKSLDTRLSAMRDELEKLEAELVEKPQAAGYSREELEALNAWWEEFTAKAVSVPVKTMPVEAHLHQDPAAEEAAVLVDPRKLNEALHEVGASCKLWWKTEKGKQRDRHILAKGQFRLGQREGKLPQYLLESSG